VPVPLYEHIPANNARDEATGYVGLILAGKRGASRALKRIAILVYRLILLEVFMHADLAE
jgi:hypothetical protein